MTSPSCREIWWDKGQLEGANFRDMNETCELWRNICYSQIFGADEALLHTYIIFLIKGLWFQYRKKPGKMTPAPCTWELPNISTIDHEFPIVCKINHYISETTWNQLVFFLPSPPLDHPAWPRKSLTKDTRRLRRPGFATTKHILICLPYVFWVRYSMEIEFYLNWYWM